MAIWDADARTPRAAEIVTAGTAAPVLCLCDQVGIGPAPARVRGVLVLDYLDFDYIGDFSPRTRNRVRKIARTAYHRYAKVLGRAGYRTEKLILRGIGQEGIFVAARPAAPGTEPRR